MLIHEREIVDCEKALAKLREKSEEIGQLEIKKMEGKLSSMKRSVYSNLSPWERVSICRHKDRPRAIDYIEALCEEFEELAGDRLFRDDSSIIGGFGIIGSQKFVIIAQEKGNDTESRLERNFGMPHPEGYRKALRLMKLAEKFSLPVLTLIDTPGAFPGLEAEERGQGSAIAKNIYEMAQLETPIISIVIGEGCSGGALGIGVCDVLGMLEHSYYSVISPEGCASILWKDTSKNEVAAGALRMHVEDLIKFEVVDEMLDEPQGGAHHDKRTTFNTVREFILRRAKELSKLPIQTLLDSRYEKFRKIGRIS